MDQPTAEQALMQLEPLVGEWTVEAKWPNGESWPGGGKITFEWHASGAHLVERATIDLPEAPDSVSVIGCDAANGTYFQLYSDDRGVSRVYEMSIGNGEWQLWREGEPFLPALRSDLQRRRQHHHRTLGDCRRRHQLHDRFRPHLPQSRHLTLEVSPQRPILPNSCGDTEKSPGFWNGLSRGGRYRASSEVCRGIT